jgi:hypothetical protein
LHALTYKIKEFIMKKSCIILAFVLVTGLTLNAQDYKTSVGLRAGIPFVPYGLYSNVSFGATIKHFLDKTNAVEGMVTSSYNGIVATGLFENEHWTGFYPGINWYWGLGAHVGLWSNGVNVYNNSNQVDSGGPGAGVDGILGVEYTFEDFPLNVSVDVHPNANVIGYRGWNLVNMAVSVRYVF